MSIKKSLRVLICFIIVFSLSFPVFAETNNQAVAPDKVSNELNVEQQKQVTKNTNPTQDQPKENIQDAKENMDSMEGQAAASSSKWSFSKAWKKFKETVMTKFLPGITEKVKELATNITGIFTKDKEANGDFEKKGNEDLIKQAQKFNVDITGLGEQEAWDKIKQAEMNLRNNSDGKDNNDLINQARKFNVDITGLSEKEAWDKIKKAEMDMKNNPNRNGNEDLHKQAEKFNVDITGLSEQDAWNKIKQAEQDLRAAERAKQDEKHLKELEPQAKRLGVDIKGLSFEEAFKKVNTANDAANWQGVLRVAAEYGVNVTGLTLEQAEAKIRQARAEDQGVNINGLSPQDAEALLQATKNNKMTPEGVLLQNTCGLLKLNSNATVKVMKEQVSAKLHINLNGLTLEEEARVIQEALAKMGLTLP